jgi:Arc/MetJ-type ribon-helix-helix transcriptional regulator
MKTPVRPVRIDEDLWKAAQRVAEDLQRETGLSVTASDVVRKALTEYVERWKAARRKSAKMNAATISEAQAELPKNAKPEQGF